MSYVHVCYFCPLFYYLFQYNYVYSCIIISGKEKYLKGDEKCEIINENYRTEVSIIPTAIINPRRMHHRVIVVILFVVCLSVCVLPLICESTQIGVK